MTKQEQIEEMAKIMFGHICTRTKCDSCKYPNKQKDCEAYRNAEALYNAGYRKIPENAVVITNEEYKRLKILEKYHITCEDVYEYVELARKETAREFAEKVKTEFYYEFDETIPSVMSDKIDRLLQEYEK